MPANLILASNSASRKMLMTGAGLAFDAMAAEIDERAIELDLASRNATPQEIAVALAQAKALAVSQARPEAYVVGSDQVLSLDGRLFHKPASRAEAVDHIKAMSGRTHYLNCGVAVAQAGSVLWSDISVAAMTMRSISPEAAVRYVETAGDDILGSVGAYQLEGLGVRLFERIEGDYFTILGLPLLKLLAALRQFGVIDA
jgi:septum formation protein